MIRKILLPAACIALLGGCATYGYSDGYGRGGYYYGQPSVSYYGGASYGYPYSAYPSYGYSRYYGSPYGYGYGVPYGYGYGYGGYYGYPRHPYQRPPHRGDGHDRDDDHDRDGRPPWRRLGDANGVVPDPIRRRQVPVPVPAQGPQPVMRPRPLMRADSQMRPAMERPAPVRREAAPVRRESAPAMRNIRERDVRRGQEP